MLLFVTVLLIYFHLVIGYIEIVNEKGWQDSEFRLTCRQLSSHIAVMEAYFTSNTTSWTWAVSPLEFMPPGSNIRLAINQRCSGRNHCSFILHADCPGSKIWGPGEVDIKYACMPEEKVIRFCNLDVVVPSGGGTAAQGFVMSPGYPKFYVGQSECRWRIRAPKHQRIEVTLLDISLSGASLAEGCEDTLAVTDNETILTNTCRESEVAPVLKSTSNTVQVTVLGRPGSLVPKRGVLMYYRAVECPTLAPPIDGYLVFRNRSIAEYRCCVGFVFPDTLERRRILHCLHNRWNENLPFYCINLQNLTHINEIGEEESKMTDNSHLVDVVIPSILIAGLLLGNAVIVFFIYQYKKRKNVEIQEEELSTMVSDTRINVP